MFTKLGIPAEIPAKGTKSILNPLAIPKDEVMIAVVAVVKFTAIIPILASISCLNNGSLVSLSSLIAAPKLTPSIIVAIIGNPSDNVGSKSIVSSNAVDTNSTTLAASVIVFKPVLNN